MLIDINETDLYKILGIDENINSDSINKVYRNLAKEYHPDKFSSMNIDEKKKNEQIFSKITSAYNILKDEGKRKQYDYERKLKLEYQKTLDNISNNNNFTFTKPVIVKKDPSKPAISVNISNKKDNNKGKASEETINAQSELLYNTSLTKINNKDYDGAILDLQTAIVVNNKIAKYHSTLALVMKEKGWLSYANAEFKKALNIDPKDKLALKHYQENITLDEEENIKVDESLIQKIISIIKSILGLSN